MLPVEMITETCCLTGTSPSGKSGGGFVTVPPASCDDIANAKTGTSSLAIAAAASSVMFSAVAPPAKKRDRHAKAGSDSTGDQEDQELDSIDLELERVQDRDLMAR